MSFMSEKWKFDFYEELMNLRRSSSFTVAWDHIILNELSKEQIVETLETAEREFGRKISCIVRYANTTYVTFKKRKQSAMSNLQGALYET